MARIVAGRLAIAAEEGDTRFSDTVDTEDPNQLLAYITSRPLSSRLYPDIALAEPYDAQILSNWMWWEGVRRDRALMKQMRNTGNHWSEIGAQLGLGREGARARYDTYCALIDHDRPDARLTREDRVVDRASTQRADARTAWFACYSDHIATVVGNVLKYSPPYWTEDIESDLQEIQRDLDNNHTWTGGGMIFLAMGVQAMMVRPLVLGLSPQHRLKSALLSAARLQEAYAIFANPLETEP